MGVALPHSQLDPESATEGSLIKKVATEGVPSKEVSGCSGEQNETPEIRTALRERGALTCGTSAKKVDRFTLGLEDHQT